MSEAAAGVINSGRVNGRVPDIDELDLAVEPDHERGAVTHAIRTQNSERLRGFARAEVAQQGHFEFQLFGKDSLRRDVIRADAKNEGIVCLKFRDTSLVRREFLRSATGEGGGEERKDYNILSFVI